MKIPLFLMMFLVISALIIVSNENLALYKSGNRAMFGSLYLSWGDKIFSNVEIIANDFKQLRWFPETNR